MSTPTLEMEVVSQNDAKLVKYAGQTGLEKSATETLVEAFRPVFAEARAALQMAQGVAESVKDATCVSEIKRSRACRLAIRAVRLKGEAIHKKQKESALRYGKAVDGFKNILLADIEPVETALQEAEDFAERAEAARKAALKASREAELAPLMETPILGNLAELSEPAYQKMLSDAKLLRQAKLDAAAKAEADRLAKAEADRIERERIDAENAKLKAEAVAREAAAKAEREAAAKKLAEERAEAARIAAEIKAKADAEAKAAAEQAARERAQIEAKAKAEAARIAEVARKEKADALAKAKAESDRLAAEAAKARAELAAKEKAELEERSRLEALAEKARAEAKAAAAAPDKAKIKAFAGVVRGLQVPPLANTIVATAIADEVERFAAWVESQISQLTK